MAASSRSANGLSCSRSEAREERGGQHRHRHAVRDRFGERPASFAGILDVGVEFREVRVFGEGTRGQLQQPRSDDAALHPERCDLRDVDVIVARVHQFEAFGVRLHQAVLDAVMDHLHVVSGSGVADAQIAVGRSQRQKDRLETLADVGVAADHQTVALLQSPDSAARPRIDVRDPIRLERSGASDIVLVVRVAAIDDRVARGQQTAEGRDG